MTITITLWLFDNLEAPSCCLIITGTSHYEQAIANRRLDESERCCEGPRNFDLMPVNLLTLYSILVKELCTSLWEENDRVLCDVVLIRYSFVFLQFFKILLDLLLEKSWR